MTSNLCLEPIKADWEGMRLGRLVKEILSKRYWPHATGQSCLGGKVYSFGKTRGIVNSSAKWKHGHWHKSFTFNVFL